MHLIFFDEVKPQLDYPHYHLGAISIDESHLAAIEQQANSVAQKVFNDVRLSRDTEFHAKDIFHRKKSFQSMNNAAERSNIIISLLEVLAKPEVNRIDIQINTKKLYNQSYAADYAFMFLCERANSLMKVKKSMGMLIGDRDNDSMTNRFSVALSQYRCKGTQFDFREEITNLFESVHFTPSHLSRFLQLADIYSWYLQFRRRHKKDNSKYRYFFEAMEEKEIHLFPTKYKIWPNS